MSESELSAGNFELAAYKGLLLKDPYPAANPPLKPNISLFRDRPFHAGMAGHPPTGLNLLRLLTILAAAGGNTSVPPKRPPLEALEALQKHLHLDDQKVAAWMATVRDARPQKRSLKLRRCCRCVNSEHPTRGAAGRG